MSPSLFPSTSQSLHPVSAPAWSSVLELLPPVSACQSLTAPASSGTLSVLPSFCLLHYLQPCFPEHTKYCLLSQPACHLPPLPCISCPLSPIPHAPTLWVWLGLIIHGLCFSGVNIFAIKCICSDKSSWITTNMDLSQQVNCQIPPGTHYA